MPRKAVSPAAYLIAWQSQRYSSIHDATLKEASRQVNEMVKWMNWQIKYDPDEMKEIHLERGVFNLVKKARNYRENMIYHRNKYIAEIQFDRIAAELAGDMDKIAEIDEQIAKWHDDQFGGFRRIVKIYCAVKSLAGGSLVLNDPEEVEYEYDPEEAS
jgi:ribosomal protein L17